MLATPWDRRKPNYDFVIVGSGYGGAITAARLAAADLSRKPSVCILERGMEWQPGDFPETLDGVLGATRGDFNPLGLYELINYRDISVIKGSGLGGTSLINANVAIVPDREVFESADWPRDIRYEAMLPYFECARTVLGVARHPRAPSLPKVQALDRRGQQIETPARALDIAVTFKTGVNPWGVEQVECIDCGNCVTGCNVKAKNTLYMNYLPIAHRAGAAIFTQTKVEWIEKRPGGWRIHGRHYRNNFDSKEFTLDAANVVLSAGSLNSTEVLLRSEMHGLSVSPALGTKFSGNGDFFGLAWNGEPETAVLGYRRKDGPGPGESQPPGPNIVAVLRYNPGRPAPERITVEDFSFPSAYVDAAKAVFGAIRGEDTVLGNEDQQLARLLNDLNPTSPSHNRNGAMNHSMLYLVMGQDDARGVILFEAPWHEPDGRIRVSWDKVGQQQIFRRMNEELRRHARTLAGNFIANPTWSVFDIGHLITAHPLGGCPMGDDYLHGAVDGYGRVFSGDGSVHDGLFVSDGSLIPSALGINPLLTISALAERCVERQIRAFSGEAYPAPPRSIAFSGADALAAIEYSEAELERLFRRSPTLDPDVMINQGGAPEIDLAERTIRNDRYWKGFFPKGHVLNPMSAALFTGFRKEFHQQNGKLIGVTSDTDGRIRARNTLEPVDVPHDAKGTLEPGRYILLRYVDPPWQGFYDIFKIISDDLLIGRVYLGEYPNGIRLFTFPMTRRYGFNQMTVEDHRQLYSTAPAPTREQLAGTWRMDVISNANQAGGIAWLRFDAKPDGRLEASYQLMGLMEGLVAPDLLERHFQLNDFTPFHDEIRFLAPDMLIGRYVTGLPPALSSLLGNSSLGIFQSEPNGQFGFYYILTRSSETELPRNTLLRPFLEARLPDGVGLTFDEKMEGWYYPGASEPSGPPAAGVDHASCSFQVRVTIRDVNEFIDGYAHEARLSGRITFGDFDGGPATFTLTEPASTFRYLWINPATREGEMRYHVVFRSDQGRQFTLEGTKQLRKHEGGGLRGIRELLNDYTTLYGRVSENMTDGSSRPIGAVYLKFRTFEDIAAIGNLAGFLNSFNVTGTGDPRIQFDARMRFMAFSGQFVMREYDPLAPDIGRLAGDVRAAVRRGADTPDYFSDQPAADLQKILRGTPTRPITDLINKGDVRIDFDKQRIFRDAFWKGSFAKDSILGWEERLRTSLISGAPAMGRIFAGGSFWKRFDEVKDGVARGYVVNYELNGLPGLPEVRTVSYPDDNRRYFRQGDEVLLLTYTNQPYRIVYDTIKVIDDQNALGVMHLGDFPNGMEFATFVMARHNYPFENMSIEDHRLILADPRAVAPGAAQLAGSWNGRLILASEPAPSLRPRINPVLFTVTFGPPAEFQLGPVRGEFHATLRAVSPDMMIGEWQAPGFEGSSAILLARSSTRT